MTAGRLDSWILDRDHDPRDWTWSCFPVQHVLIFQLPDPPYTGFKTYHDIMALSPVPHEWQFPPQIREYQPNGWAIQSLHVRGCLEQLLRGVASHVLSLCPLWGCRKCSWEARGSWSQPLSPPGWPPRRPLLPHPTPRGFSHLGLLSQNTIYSLWLSKASFKFFVLLLQSPHYVVF